MPRILIFLCTILVCSPMAIADDDFDARDSIVKIFATYRGADFSRPWTKQSPQEFSGTGFVIDGNLILTNAHVVEQSSQIFIQPPNSADKLRATVVGISQAMDMAILQLKKTSEREEFHADHPPLVLQGELPAIGETVQAIGYPVGGEQVSITEGVVSRIEYTGYNMDAAGLRLQVDAALNHGNSGGPVMMNDEVVGVVFSGIEYAENIGYVIPTEEVLNFITDIKDGTYDGPPTLDRFGFQTCENDSLRDWLGLSKEQTGLVYIRAKEGIETPLEKWDVIDKIGEFDIDNAGMVKLTDDLRLLWPYFIRQLTTEEGTVEMTIIRKGKSMQVDLVARNNRDMVIPFIGNDYPEYFVIGPMIFTPIRREHFFELNLWYGVIDGSPATLHIEDVKEYEGQEFVVIASDFLPHPITKGYDISGSPTLKSVNGTDIKSLAHAVELMRDTEGDFIEFAFFDRRQETLIFNHDELLEATEEILEDNSIRKQGSDRFMDIWEE
ncbi:MAG: trypsin-like peptidase domain-containing protein [Phycisphaerales bacterium]|nr:trypsin-like peptidase domain-containing protein [Phycisphaerales bacterium]